MADFFEDTKKEEQDDDDLRICSSMECIICQIVNGLNPFFWRVTLIASHSSDTTIHFFPKSRIRKPPESGTYKIPFRHQCLTGNFPSTNEAPRSAPP